MAEQVPKVAQVPFVKEQATVEDDVPKSELVYVAQPFVGANAP